METSQLTCTVYKLIGFRKIRELTEICFTANVFKNTISISG